MPYVGRKANSFTTVVDVTVSDDLTVTDDATIGGALSAKGGAVFNEDSADVDFRVESNGNANMLFVDGGNDRVGIGTNSPTSGSSLEVRGSASNGQIYLGGSTSGTYGKIYSDNDGVLVLSADAANNSASSSFSVEVDGTEKMRIDSSGAVTMPLQPAFLATVNGAQSDMAVGTDVTINFATEIFDIGSNFASNTFTAPVTGKYQLNLSVRLAALDSASPYYIVSIETSNRLYRFIFDPDFGQDAVFWNVTQSVIADMDAGDAAWVNFNAGGGAAQVDVSSDQAYTKFGGILIG